MSPSSVHGMRFRNRKPYLNQSFMNFTILVSLYFGKITKKSCDNSITKACNTEIDVHGYKFTGSNSHFSTVLCFAVPR